MSAFCSSFGLSVLHPPSVIVFVCLCKRPADSERGGESEHPQSDAVAGEGEPAPFKDCRGTPDWPFKKQLTAKVQSTAGE